MSEQKKQNMESMKEFSAAMNQIWKRIDGLYHLYSMFAQLSDPALYVLCTLFEDASKRYTQQDLTTIWSFPKQTMNYTIGALIKRGWIQLEPCSQARNSKWIRLTDEGIAFCKKTICPLFDAENRAAMHFNDEDRNRFQSLMEQYGAFLEQEIQKTIQEQTPK